MLALVALVLEPVFGRYLVGAGWLAHAGWDWAHRDGRMTLVHGAFADSTGWNAEIAMLHRLEYPVVTAANPLRGLTNDADYVRAVLQSISGPIVLVGHSYGGAVGRLGWVAFFVCDAT